MADVTISQLQTASPSGNNVIPFSTSFNTFKTSVSSLFENTNFVGINTVPKTGINVGGVNQFNDPNIALVVKNPYEGLSFYPNATFFTDISANKRNFLSIFTSKNSGWVEGNPISLVFGALTATPGAAFTPAPGYTDSSFSIGAWGGRSGISLLSNGNVGIGTTTPNAKLDVNGDINSTNTSKAFAIFDGSNAENTDCTILKSYNISRIQKLNAPGRYKVSFTKNVPWPYAPTLASFNNNSGDGGWLSISYDNDSEPSSTGFNINAFTHTGASWQSQKYISFSIF